MKGPIVGDSGTVFRVVIVERKIWLPVGLVVNLDEIRVGDSVFVVLVGFFGLSIGSDVECAKELERLIIGEYVLRAELVGFWA